MSKCRHFKIRAIADGSGFTFRCDRCGHTPARLRDDYGKFLAMGLDTGAGRGPEAF